MLHRFTGPGPMTYPETRDARDIPLGTVEPGDERDFSQAPDQWWVPAGGGSGTEGTAGTQDEPPPEDAEATAEENTPAPGPVPAPPAVIPGA